MESLNLPLKYRGPAGYGERTQFQRGREKAPVKRIQRRVAVKFKHIFLFFFLVCASFYSLIKLYLFLVTGDHFEVKRAQIVCRREFVRQDIQALIDASKLGNLLLLDISRLQERLEAHRWVKEARLRKVFPSTLRIEITEREPAAIMKSGESYLMIDRDGVWLEPLAAREDANLPLLLDSASFKENYQDKLALAWRCLDALMPGERLEVEALDLSEPGSVSAYLAGQTTRLILGGERFSERLSFIRSYKQTMEDQNGALEYIDLRFDDRIIFKPLPAVEMAAVPNPREEVN